MSWKHDPHSTAPSELCEIAKEGDERPHECRRSEIKHLTLPCSHLAARTVLVEQIWTGLTSWALGDIRLHPVATEQFLPALAAIGVWSGSVSTPLTHSLFSTSAHVMPSGVTNEQHVFVAESTP